MTTNLDLPEVHRVSDEFVIFWQLLLGRQLDEEFTQLSSRSAHRTQNTTTLQCSLSPCLLRAMWLIFVPVSVVDDRVHDGVHLLGEPRGVGRVFLHRWAAASLLGLEAAVVARRVLVLSPFALALLQTDLLLHLLQVAVLDGLEADGGRGGVAVSKRLNNNGTNWPRIGLELNGLFIERGPIFFNPPFFSPRRHQ